MSAPEKMENRRAYQVGVAVGKASRQAEIDALETKARAEARREALREARDNISGSCWAMPSNGGTRSYNRGVQDSLSVIDALLDTDAPAQSKPDAVQGWQPIETAPRDGRGLLGWWPHWTAFPVRIWWQDNQWHMAEDHPATWHDDMPREHGPIHWMPLPAPPKDRAHD